MKHAIQCDFVALAAESSVSASSSALPTPTSDPRPQYLALPHPNYPVRNWNRPPPQFYSPVGTPNGRHYANGQLGEEPRRDLLDHLPSATLTPPVSKNEDWKLDMELMHHFCTVTCDTLCNREDSRHVWRVLMPMEGYQNEFVMHMILAISALHKCSLTTSPQLQSQYRKASEIHSSVGIAEFRDRVSKEHSSFETWQSFFAFASLLSIYLAATPIRIGSTRWPSPISDALDFFASIKGLRAVMEPFQGFFRWSRLAALSNSLFMGNPTLLGSAFVSRNSQLPEDVWAQMTHLHNFIDHYEFAPAEGDKPDDESGTTSRGSVRRKDHEIALESLEQACRVVELAGPHIEPGMVFFWAYHLNKLFQEDLRIHDPAALVLLAHFCIVLRLIDHAWFINYLGHQVLEDIEKNIQPQYRPLLAWPMKHSLGR